MFTKALAIIFAFACVALVQASYGDRRLSSFDDEESFGRSLSSYGDRRLSSYGDRRLSSYGDRRLASYGERRLSSYGDDGYYGGDELMMDADTEDSSTAGANVVAAGAVVAGVVAVMAGVAAMTYRKRQAAAATAAMSAV